MEKESNGYISLKFTTPHGCKEWKLPVFRDPMTKDLMCACFFKNHDPVQAHGKNSKELEDNIIIAVSKYLNQHSDAIIAESQLNPFGV